VDFLADFEEHVLAFEDFEALGLDTYGVGARGEVGRDVGPFGGQRDGLGAGREVAADEGGVEWRALALGQANALLKRLNRKLNSTRLISVISGLFVTVVGFLMLTNTFQAMSVYFNWLVFL